MSVDSAADSGSETLATIAGLIREHRARRGWTARELAEHCGVSQPVVTGWESGRKGIRLAHVEALARALGPGFARGVGEALAGVVDARG